MVRAVAYMGELLKQRTNGGIDIGPNDKDSENFTVGQARTGLLDLARVDGVAGDDPGDGWATGGDPIRADSFRPEAGLVDLAEGTWPDHAASAHDRVAPYFNLTKHSMMPSVLVFSHKTWLELADDEQKTIRTAAEASVMFLRQHIDCREVEARLKAEADGAQVIDDVDRRSFAKALVPLYPQLAPEPGLQAMVREAQSNGDVASVP